MNKHCGSKQSRHGSLHSYKDLMEKGNCSLPYYIVPVLYVPHKPLYDAKKPVDPCVYKAFQCKSKERRARKESESASTIISHNSHYSFERLDEYFKNCIESARGSEISLYSTKSGAITPSLSEALIPPTKPMSRVERRRALIQKFPSLFNGYQETMIDATSEVSNGSLLCLRLTQGTQTVIQDIKNDIIALPTGKSSGLSEVNSIAF